MSRRLKKPGPLNTPPNRVKVVEQGVEPRASLTDGALFSFAESVNPDTHGLVIANLSTVYDINGSGVMMEADGSGFTYHCPRTCPAHTNQLAWQLLDLSRALDAPIQRERLNSFNYTNTNGSGYWDYTDLTVDAVTNFQTVNFNQLWWGEYPDKSSASYCASMHGEMTSATNLRVHTWTFNGAWSGYLYYELWPLKPA